MIEALIYQLAREHIIVQDTDMEQLPEELPTVHVWRQCMSAFETIIDQRLSDEEQHALLQKLWDCDRVFINISEGRKTPGLDRRVYGTSAMLHESIGGCYHNDIEFVIQLLVFWALR